jgi:hypothetical protein
MPEFFKELEAALERTLRAEYRDIDGRSPFFNIAGHLEEILAVRQADQLAHLLNRVVDAVEGDEDRLPAGNAT